MKYNTSSTTLASILISTILSTSYALDVDPRITINERLKQTDRARSSAASRIDLSREFKFDARNLTREMVAVYVDRKISENERAGYLKRGLEIIPELYVPPVPNHHEHGFYLAYLDYTALPTLRNDSNIVRLSSASNLSEPLNDLSRAMLNVDIVHTGTNVGPYDGTGVKVAIADSGFDLNHPDFPVPVEAYDVTDGNTVLDWGTDVTAPLDSHGTHVAGSVLGRGVLNNAYKGSAPGAEFYAYKIGDDTISSAVTDDDYIKAVNRSIDMGVDIFSISYGGFTTWIDGSNPVAQAFDNAATQGMLCFAAAGNSQHVEEHISMTTPPGQTVGTIELRIRNTSNSSNYTTPSYIKAVWWDDVDNDFNISLNGTNLAAGEVLYTEANNNWQGTSSRGTEARFYELTPNIPPSTTKFFTFDLENTAGSGTTPLVHLYVIGRGDFQNADENYTVVSPALADTVIAVGAWVQRDSWVDYTGTPRNFGQTLDTLATFSSKGPRIDGLLKPEIIAPGSATISLRSVNTANTMRIIDTDGINLDGSGPADYYVIHGTSMSCPHAAGVAALVKEARPDATVAELRDALFSTAENFGTPNNDVGYGMLDAEAAAQSIILSDERDWQLLDH